MGYKLDLEQKLMQLLVIHPKWEQGNKQNVSGVMFILCSTEQNIASMFILMRIRFSCVYGFWYSRFWYIWYLLIFLNSLELASIMSMMYNNVKDDFNIIPSVDISSRYISIVSQPLSWRCHINHIHEYSVVGWFFRRALHPSFRNNVIITVSK